ncbi:MAG: adenosylcobinamide-phosphate synthase CbiB [Verrucomicrobiota bacterium]|nr:adenosylcobinamide-phosphate synthase CbiB [Verrucomicrobiota bacterium]
MRLEYQIAAAVLLDFVLGDPRWLPHPARAIGRLAAWAEPRARRFIPRARIAGAAAWLFVAGLASAAAWGLWTGAARLHPALGDIAGVWIIYTTLAARDLARHGSAVRAALVAGDIPEARRKLAMIVGRDTDALDESEIARATVETVAESALDGVTAPLFFAFLFGPVGAVAYRAVNTLDSMWGHKNERYLAFGWAAARSDDAANWIPARLTGPCMALAAWCLRLSGGNAWRILLRDARKHPSFNSGFPEAAMAGALRVRMGGTNYYGGEPEERPHIGDPISVLDARHIALANRLMFTTVLLFTAAGFAIMRTCS